MDLHSEGSGPDGGGTVVVISADTMGRGDNELGYVLIRNYLHALTEVTPIPETLIFYNSGVRLAAQGSPAIADLSALEERGVKILLCGTCVNHFGLQDRVAAGEISNAYTIAETMLRAGKVVTL